MDENLLAFKGIYVCVGCVGSVCNSIYETTKNVQQNERIKYSNKKTPTTTKNKIEKLNGKMIGKKGLL